MARIPAPVAAVRTAVRRGLADLPPAALVLVACSGGADSLSLAAAARFVAARVGLVTVDHGLQEGSDRRARSVAAWARAADFDPVRVCPVTVTGLPGGPEAAARTARYEALEAAAAETGAAAVLLGHTRDDQAETVLLALARGAGPRGLSGMPARRGVFRRPLLDVSRSDTRKACAALGLAAWEDPHNTDPAYARARVRATALPTLVAELGPAVVGNLARTATLLAADTAALDELAAAALDRARSPAGLAVPALAALAGAIRGRVLHRWALELGAPGSALAYSHVTSLDALVTGWRGQGPAHLPGGIAVGRQGSDLVRVVPAIIK
ncbi:tRNA(Ile)-lysidine synthetase [Actinoplanes sp. SE50]|uniref:tRNA lysidine(34) synthetase TilS n=1 Tax=unclassified Actinoplanes TaxID=2626549 RepID=UPI00023EE044|nr:MULTISPECIES: tRNA lysidine(34) synthetase TilS [unclassified Actinoplanes]AEV88970.1 tRNA(Ile)-lysidine synthase [Actinoplanes sp. SE50/110]ATO87376.1 tRNA(Ile)-lysidine synthetase [Actinoplanes sp. SE50]SLM04794.1 tRNA(Ile)-lysidine synthetase [Actinoplanes sp. SE50/110]